MKGAVRWGLIVLIGLLSVVVVPLGLAMLACTRRLAELEIADLPRPQPRRRPERVAEHQSDDPIIIGEVRRWPSSGRPANSHSPVGCQHNFVSDGFGGRCFCTFCGAEG